jgi:ribosomal protein S6
MLVSPCSSGYTLVASGCIKTMEDNEKTPKTYEMSFLVVNEDDVSTVADVIKKFNGTVTKEPSVRRIALAYEIAKQTSAVFGFCNFQMGADDVKALEHDLRTNATILRSLILSVPQKKERSAGEEKPRTYRPMPAKPIIEKKPAPVSLSNEALTRKIEEILQ